MSDPSTLSNIDLHFPLNSAGIKKLRAHLGAAFSEQATSADATTALVHGQPCNHAGKVMFVRVDLALGPAASELMSYDLKLNGTTVLSAPFVITGADAAKFHLVPFLATQVAVGDIWTVVRDYTAGGGSPVMTYNSITVGWALWLHKAALVAGGAVRGFRAR